MPTYVYGYKTIDGKFFEERDDAVLYEQELLFSELYNELACTDDELPTADYLLNFFKDQASNEMLSQLIDILRAYRKKTKDPNDPTI